MFNTTIDSNDNELIALAQSRTPEAVHASEVLFSRHTALVKAIILKVTKWGLTITKYPELNQELYQEACLAFIEAIQIFDSTRGVKFTTFAWIYIYHNLQTFLRKELSYLRSIDLSQLNDTFVLRDGLSEDQSGDDMLVIPVVEPGFDEVESDQINQQVDEFLAVLSPRQQAYIRKVFWGSLSKSEVARCDNVSPTMVRKVIGQALTMGRRHFHSNPYLH